MTAHLDEQADRMPGDTSSASSSNEGPPRRPSPRLLLRAAARPQNLLHDQIAAVWERLLDRHHVGIDEAFDALGGGPALCERMLDELKWLTGERLHASEFPSGLTIWHASDALVERLPDQAIVQIQAGDPAVPPLVFLHGDLCGGWYYLRELGRALGAERPVYAVRQHGMRGEEIPLSIPVMAADHVAELLRVWPARPLHVGGFCNGAMVALDVAHQLSRLGHAPASLLLLEPPLRLAPAARELPRLPILSAELRRSPAIRGAWAFVQYRIAMKTYACPAVYSGPAAALWARDGRLGSADARAAFQDMATHGAILTTPGTHLATLGRNVRAAGQLLRGYLQEVDEARRV